MNQNNFIVYILFSEKLNRYYIGSTDDVCIRMEEHNNQLNKKSFTYRGIPWILVFLINNLKSKQAFEIEKHIKAMKSKKYIANLIQYQNLKKQLIDRYS